MNVDFPKNQTSRAGLEPMPEPYTRKTVCPHFVPIASIRCINRSESLTALERMANVLNPYLVPRNSKEYLINGAMTGFIGTLALYVGGIAGFAVVGIYVGLGLTTTQLSSDPFRQHS